MKRETRAVIESVVAGAGVYLLRPTDWPGWVRWAYVAAPSTLVMAGVALMTGLAGPRQNPSAEASDAASSERVTRTERSLASLQSSPLPARWAMVLGAGAAMSAAQAFSLAADASIERWLTRRGLRRPRLLMGVVVASMPLAECVSTTHAESRHREVPG